MLPTRQIFPVPVHMYTAPLVPGCTSVISLWVSCLECRARDRLYKHAVCAGTSRLSESERNHTSQSEGACITEMKSTVHERRTNARIWQVSKAKTIGFRRHNIANIVFEYRSCFATLTTEWSAQGDLIWLTHHVHTVADSVHAGDAVTLLQHGFRADRWDASGTDGLVCAMIVNWRTEQAELVGFGRATTG